MITSIIKKTSEVLTKAINAVRNYKRTAMRKAKTALAKATYAQKRCNEQDFYACLVAVLYAIQSYIYAILALAEDRALFARDALLEALASLVAYIKLQLDKLRACYTDKYATFARIVRVVVSMT